MTLPETGPVLVGRLRIGVRINLLLTKESQMKLTQSVQDRLLEAIKAHGSLDDDEIKQAAEHGADSGFSGFTYYGDTGAFYEANKDDIWELLFDDASGQGISAVELIASFGCKDSVVNHETFANALAWYALESVGHWLQS